MLGPDASLRHAAALAGLTRDRAGAAADRLHEAELVAAGTSLSFVHPIVAESVSSQLPPARRAALHGQAARMLEADEAPVDRVAAHLLFAEPRRSPGGRRPEARRGRGPGPGRPRGRVSCLRRAQLEPPPPEARVAVLVELGRAEALLPTTQDYGTLREALARAATPPERAEIAYELALALFGVMRNAEAIAVLEAALADDDGVDAATVARLEAALIGGGIGDLTQSPRLLARAQRHLDAARRGEIDDPLMISTLAQVTAVAGELRRAGRSAGAPGPGRRAAAVPLAERRVHEPGARAVLERPGAGGAGRDRAGHGRGSAPRIRPHAAPVRQLRRRRGPAPRRSRSCRGLRAAHV